MSNALITNSTLEDIADAIRAKLGTQATMLPSEMAGNIADIPSGGGEAVTLLWTNSSVSSSFASQDVALDLSGYRYVIIRVKESTSSSNYMTYLIRVKNVAAKLGFADKQYSGYPASYDRSATASSTKVAFGNCNAHYYNGSSSQSPMVNSYCIPYKIWGLTTEINDLA